MLAQKSVRFEIASMLILVALHDRREQIWVMSLAMNPDQPQNRNNAVWATTLKLVRIRWAEGHDAFGWTPM